MQLNQMLLNVNWVSYGVIEESGQKYASVQTLTDFVEHEGRCGCSVGKMDIVTIDNFAVAKRMYGEIQRAKGPVSLIVEVGSAVKKGNVTSAIKDFKLANQPQAKSA